MADELKHLILTGDDFGRTPAINAAIEQYHTAGALTHASLMVAEPHVAEAVEIARGHPKLCVGLHLTLCAGRATRSSRLTDSSGNSMASPIAAGLRYAFDPRLAEPLRGEIRRQFEQFRALGFPPTYWDGHTHLHLHPTVFRLTLPIAREFGFRFVRLVREPGPWALVPWIFERLSAMALVRLRAAGIGFADRVYGLRKTGRMTCESIQSTLRDLPSGVSELYFHPGAELHLPEPGDFARLIGQSGVTLLNGALGDA